MESTKKIFMGIAAILSLCFIGMLTMAIYTISSDSQYNHENAYQMILPIMAISIIFLVIFIMAYIIGHFVFKDAKKRGMDPWVWTGISIFIPNFIGLIIYLIIRNSHIVHNCPNCNEVVDENFINCPFCGYRLKGICQSCGEPISFKWSICPKCGEKLKQ